MNKISVVPSNHNCGTSNHSFKNANVKTSSLKRHHSKFESPAKKIDHKKMKKNFQNSNRYNNVKISSENIGFMSSNSSSDQESMSFSDPDDIQILVNPAKHSIDEGYGIFCKSIFDDGNTNVYFLFCFLFFI
tara:strand:+ start:769 stop:1164 length:396 start_codon:yes stop_codon:yes gene_type:complete